MGLRGILFGTECHGCAAFGINCTQTGLLSIDTMLEGASSVIHTANGRRFGCEEPIAQCAAVQGKSTHKEVANNVNSVVAKIEHFVVQPNLESRSSKTVIFESLDKLKLEVPG